VTRHKLTRNDLHYIRVRSKAYRTQQQLLIDKRKKLSYRRGTTRCAVSVEILSAAAQLH